jgi:hypothetical protein
LLVQVALDSQVLDPDRTVGSREPTVQEQGHRSAVSGLRKLGQVAIQRHDDGALQTGDEV